MAVRAEAQVTNFFDQAAQTIGEMVKAGVRMQEEVAQWWSDAFQQAGPVREWQTRSRAIVNEAIPVAQQNTEQWMKVIEQNYRRSMDLMKRALDSDGASNPRDIQERTRELWEASLEVVRENAQAVAQANSAMLETWGTLLRRNMAAGTEMAEKAAQAVPRPAK